MSTIQRQSTSSTQARGYPTSKFSTEHTFPLLEELWVKQFMLNEAQIAQRRPALRELANQIARFFGPEAQPQTRQQVQA